MSETGDAAPEITKLPLLARTFGVTADWLLDDEAGFEEDAPEEHASEESAETPVDRPAPEPVQTYPEWIDHLPGFLGRMLKKYGWLFGVRLAISGVLFAVMGMVAMAIASSMSNSFQDMSGGMFPAMQNAGVTLFDENGNQVAPSHFGLTDRDLQAMGLGASSGYSPFGGFGMTSSMTEPFDIFCGFIIMLGVVQLAGGLFLAWYLKKKGQESL